MSWPNLWEWSGREWPLWATTRDISAGGWEAAIQKAVIPFRQNSAMIRNKLAAVGFGCLCTSTVIAAPQVQNVPGRSCYYPTSQGYWAPKLRQQQIRTKVCLIRISYEIAAGNFANKDPGLAAADYCQQAYTFEEEKLAAKNGRPINLDAARTRAAAFARPWIEQGIRLKCVPPSAQ